MAHNLEMINGEASYFGVREPAWHKLGVTIPEYATAEEAIEAWNEYRELCEGNNEHPVDCGPLAFRIEGGYVVKIFES